MSKHKMTVTEARMMSNSGEITDVERVSTDALRHIVAVLDAADWRRADVATAADRAHAELDFRIRHGL